MTATFAALDNCTRLFKLSVKIHSECLSKGVCLPIVWPNTVVFTLCGMCGYIANEDVWGH